MSTDSKPVSVIGEEIRSHHDTLYVNTEQFENIKRDASIPGLTTSAIDNVKLSDITIVVVENLDFAILCRAEDIFPTKSYWEQQK